MQTQAMPINPITKKLLIKPDSKVLAVNVPANYLDLLGALPDGAQIITDPKGTYDGVLLFVKNSSNLTRDLEWLQKHLLPDTVFWIIYPKKSSGTESDLEMMSSWDELKKYSYTGVAAAAINETWTALRFRLKELVKTSETCASELPKNDFGRYIDVLNRTIALPEDLKVALEKQPEALAFFHQLSFTNRKEYVGWVLTAKQDKTRTERVTKTMEKLLIRKKNPSEK